MTRARTAILFVDGNNFYHGMKKLGLPANELDYEKLSQKLVLGREWLETRYYIGKVRQEGDLTRYQNQRRFLDNLAKFNKVNCFLGRIEPRPVKMAARLSHWLDKLECREDIELPEKAKLELRKIANADNGRQYVEKAVDVMIATDMCSMAYENAYDAAYLLSADGDFTPVMEKVRGLGKKVFVASPVEGYEIAGAADTFIPMKEDFFNGCWM